MKAAISLSRIFVGVLFIFSGLVKANDPLGLAYKMEEFFLKWNEGLANGSFFLNKPLIGLFNFFDDHSLALSVIMIAFEIIAGAALLLGWRIKLFSWLLLLLIVFFTFLTGYAYLSGKFKNCGCFGDCIPITPQVSFLKDIILTVLIGFLFGHRNKIRPLFSERTSLLTMLAVTAFSFGIQWYTLTYLPFADCLPFKKGNNIPEQMRMPANAIPDSTVITFVYEKDGKQIEFTADKFPADFNASYKFISRYDKVVRKGKNNEAPIHGFVLTGEDKSNDSAAIVLAQPYAILLFCEDFSTPFSKWENDFEKLYTIAKQKNIPVYAITSTRDSALQLFTKAGFGDVQVFNCDYTAIRTAARTNPCLYLLKQGTVVDKWSYKRMGNVLRRLDPVPVQIPAQPPVELPQDTSHGTPATGNQQPATGNQP